MSPRTKDGQLKLLLYRVVANCWSQPRIDWMDCLGFDASFRRVGDEERVLEVAPWASLMYYTV